MAKTSKSNKGAGNGKGPSVQHKNRREVVGSHVPQERFDIRALLAKPSFLNGLAFGLAFVILAAIVVVGSRERTIERPDQIMTGTRLTRVDFHVTNNDATRVKRDEARQSAPQVYRQLDASLDELAGQLKGLPKALGEKTDVSEVSEALRNEYQLTNEGLAEISRFVRNGETSAAWQRLVTDLVENQLVEHPLIPSSDYQNHWAARAYSSLKRMKLEESGAMVDLGRVDAIELPDEPTEELRRSLRDLVTAAGFDQTVAPFVTAKLLHDCGPTLVFDAQETESQAELAASEIPTQYDEHEAGELIYRRGDILTLDQYEMLLSEAAAVANDVGAAQRWLPRIGSVGVALVIALLLIMYLARVENRVLVNPLRLVAIGLLMIGMLAISTAVVTKVPSMAAVAPVLFVTIVLLLAYDHRFAAVAGVLQSILTTMALEQDLSWLILEFMAVGVIVTVLHEIRHRNSVIRATGLTGIALAITSVFMGLVSFPPVDGLFIKLIETALWTGGACVGIGFIVLGILPGIERLFGITTGMTLAELRDPRHPLLNELQERAPGTYNHSLQVANLAEAAVDAIGGNSLLTYVSALYHDIGKMHKPEYFIENQSDGENKHDKLSPAMSLLVITAHVKDGIELAREYGLPRPIIDFIATHHGTTLVEYFYHAAKSKAADDGKETVNEFEFRYPGPKPHTRETAILMLCDAVESAARTMPEITATRIETLVHSMALKRLEDGQFDDSPLTFRELHTVEETIISRLRAIYHSRVSYPTDEEIADEHGQETKQDDSVQASTAESA